MSDLKIGLFNTDIKYGSSSFYDLVQIVTGDSMLK